MESKGNVIVVADRPSDCSEVLASLRRSREFDVCGPLSAIEMLRHCVDSVPVAALVHVHLKDLSGEELCGILRGRFRTANVALLLFTPHLNARRPLFPPGSVDRFLDHGECRRALDHLSSVLAHRGHSSGAATALAREFRGQRLTANFDKVQVLVDEGQIDLRPRELRLLQLLVTYRGRVLTRADILKLAWDEQCDGRSRTIDVHIRRLRQKLGPAAVQIETVAGMGYRFTEG